MSANRKCESSRLQGLAIFMNQTITAMRGVNEPSMDSTHETNDIGAELFAVMGELDGTRIPLAYLFKIKTTARNERKTEHQEQGTMVELLCLFPFDISASTLMIKIPLKSAPLNLFFVELPTSSVFGMAKGPWDRSWRTHPNPSLKPLIFLQKWKKSSLDWKFVRPLNPFADQMANTDMGLMYTLLRK